MNSNVKQIMISKQLSTVNNRNNKWPPQEPSDHHRTGSLNAPNTTQKPGGTWNSLRSLSQPSPGGRVNYTRRRWLLFLAFKQVWHPKGINITTTSSRGTRHFALELAPIQSIDWRRLRSTRTPTSVACVSFVCEEKQKRKE